MSLSSGDVFAGVIGKVLSKDPGGRFASWSDFATVLSNRAPDAADQTVASPASEEATREFSAPTPIASSQPQHRRTRPAVLIAVAATVALLALAGIVGAGIMRHRAATSAESADTETSGTATAPPVQLTRYITDSAGKLTPNGRSAVESALAKLSTRPNRHLWVAYAADFSGLGAHQWAESTMLANGFTDTDGLLAIDTTNRTFAFRPPAIMHANTEAIRKERIAPAVHLREWARAAVAAANGLEIAD